LQRPCHGLANPDGRNIVRVSEGNCTLTNPVEANCRVLVPTSSRLWVQNPEKVLLPFVLFISPQGQGTQCIASVGPCQGSFIFAGSFLYALCYRPAPPPCSARSAKWASMSKSYSRRRSQADAASRRSFTSAPTSPLLVGSTVWSKNAASRIFSHNTHELATLHGAHCLKDGAWVLDRVHVSP
jgi:hypothetical protein